MSAFEKIDLLFKEFMNCQPSETGAILAGIIESFMFLSKSERNKKEEIISTWLATESDIHPLKIASGTFLLALNAYYNEDYNKTLRFGVEAKKIFAENESPNGVALSSTVLGGAFRTLGNFDLALNELLEAFEQLKSTDLFFYSLMICEYQIGNIYLELQNYEKAKSLFLSLFEISSKMNNNVWLINASNALGKIYLVQNEPSEAKKAFESALTIAEKLNHPTFISNTLSELANYYVDQADFSKAEEFHQKALDIRNEHSIIGGAITNYISLAELFAKQSNYDEAITKLGKALKLAEQINVKPKMDQIHLNLSVIYENNGNLEKSLFHYKQFHDLHEQREIEESSRKIKNALTIFEAEQTRKENIIIKKQKQEIEAEKKRSDTLLLNILPEEVAEELKSKGSAEAKQYDQVSVLFTDFKNFTKLSEKMTAKELVEEMHTCFKAFDKITEKYGIEKIKTIGDSFMCAGGLPVANQTHAIDIVRVGLEIKQFVENRVVERIALGKEPFHIRIGIHTGPVVAGIVGIKKFAYDIWGDTVNTASRMESSGEVGQVNISGATYELVKDSFTCTYRGKIQAKGKGELDMYFVV